MDFLIFIGSHADGFSNDLSDIDMLYCSAEIPENGTEEQWRQVFINNRRYDVCCTNRNSIKYLFDELGSNESYGPALTRKIDFAHKIINGMVVFGEESYQELTSEFDTQKSLCKISAMYMRYAAASVEDLVGSIQEDDLITGVYHARKLLRNSIDAYVINIAKRFTRERWRYKRLRVTPNLDQKLITEFLERDLSISTPTHQPSVDWLVECLELYRKIQKKIYFPISSRFEEAQPATDLLKIRYRRKPLIECMWRANSFFFHPNPLSRVDTKVALVWMNLQGESNMENLIQTMNLHYSSYFSSKTVEREVGLIIDILVKLNIVEVLAPDDLPIHGLPLIN